MATTLRCPLCFARFTGRDGPLARCAACATPSHGACVAELGVACATLGCARGPRPRPHPAAPQTAPPPGLLWPLAFTWLLFVAWPFALLVWLLTLGRAWSRPRRARSLAAALLLSPFVAVPLLAAVRACHGYASGTAVLEVGRDEEPGLDPEVRCPRRHGSYFEAQPLSRWTNELVLRGLTRLLGVLPGGYDGPLPSTARAADLVVGAAIQTIAPGVQPGTGPSSATLDRTLRLDLEERSLRLELSWPLTAEVLRQDPVAVWHPVRVARVGRRAVLLAAADDPSVAALVDLRTNRVVAAVPLSHRTGLLGR